MKNPNRDTITRLEELPNIGKKIAEYLRMVGIEQPGQLVGKSPLNLYETLCKKADKPFDPCLLDTFMAAVQFMEGGAAAPWWAFTEKRKLILGKRKNNRGA